MIPTALGRVGREELDQEFTDLIRLVLHGKVTTVAEDVERGIGDGALQFVRPVHDLPGIVFTPDDLDWYAAKLTQATRDFQRVLWIVVPDLMLEQAGLTDRARDEV